MGAPRRLARGYCRPTPGRGDPAAIEDVRLMVPTDRISRFGSGALVTDKTGVQVMVDSREKMLGAMLQEHPTTAARMEPSGTHGSINYHRLHHHVRARAAVPLELPRCGHSSATCLRHRNPDAVGRETCRPHLSVRHAVTNPDLDFPQGSPYHKPPSMDPCCSLACSGHGAAPNA